MAYSNGEITAPVSINDVQHVLGVSANDVGNLCRSEKINKWARYKPVIYQGFPIRGVAPRDYTFEAVTGLSISGAIDKPRTIVNYEDFEIGYDRPTGGMLSPYRLTDFVKYNHYAQKPAEIYWRNTGFKLDKGYGCQVAIYDRTSTAEESEYISFSDVMKEVLGYAGFKNKKKRLCLAVIDTTSQNQEPFFYFFSDTFDTVGSSGSWTVSTNMFNSNFTGNLTVGKTYKFVVMIVSTYEGDYISEVIPGTDRYRWEMGIDATEMASMESGSNPIQAMSLAFEKDIEWTTKVLQQARVITDLSYYLDALWLDKYGNNVVVGAYNKLCMQISLPTITVRSPNALNDSAQYQMRVLFIQGMSSYTIFQPTDKVGNNYYEIASTSSTSLAETAITPWVRVDDIGGPIGTETDAAGKTIYVYEFDFPNRIYTILSQTMAQTQGLSSGLFLFFDQQGASCNVTFRLYYKENADRGERNVREFSVTYNTAQNTGSVQDIEF
ncbi:MAG: hypothetical protein II822_10560 [Prevotella sp.]|nr:hypothetical protein [Prevotella sp.]